MTSEKINKPREIFFASCDADIKDPINGKITGELPSWIKGALLRNGPGQFQFGSDTYDHYFDGASVMHKFNIENGNVTYSNRFLISDTYSKNLAAKRIVVSQFGTSAYDDPCLTIFQRFMSWFSVKEITDNANVNLVEYGDGLYASTETTVLYRVDPKTLETGEKVDVANYVSLTLHTAHAHNEPDGTTLNFGLGFGSGGAMYRLVKFPPLKGKETFEQASIVANVPSIWRMNPSYFHSFSMTENYVIFIDQSLVISVPSMASMRYTKSSFQQCLKFYKEKTVTFHVVEKKTGQQLSKKFKAKPFFFFHSVNAFEESGNIVMDLCCYNDSKIIDTLSRNFDEPGGIIGYAESYFWRFILPVEKQLNVGENLITDGKNSTECNLLSDGTIFCNPIAIDLQGNNWELPRINYAMKNGKNYRYVYSIGTKRDEEHLETRLLKVDIDTKEVKTWFEQGLVPSEPVFVPHPTATEEDDGVILSSVLSLDANATNLVYLLVLDAKNFEELARVEFETPCVIPKDLHGVFVSES